VRRKLSIHVSVLPIINRGSRIWLFIVKAFVVQVSKFGRTLIAEWMQLEMKVHMSIAMGCQHSWSCLHFYQDKAGPDLRSGCQYICVMRSL
jgi:hypothetical protein